MASAKATFRLLSLTLITFVGWSLVNAQSLTLGLKGGLFYLVSTESASSGRDIYLSHESGFGFGPWEPWVDMECRYKPLRGLVTFAADASYSWLKGDGNYYRVSASGNGSGGPEFRGDLYVVSGGAQADLLSGPIRPYVGLRLLWTHLNDVQRVSMESNEFASSGFDSFGVGLLGGATIDLSASLALDLSARYNFTEIDRTRGYNPYFNGLFIGAGLLFELL